MAPYNDNEELREKQFLWTARAFAIFCAVSLFCNIVVFATIMNIMPLEKVTPYFVDFNDRSDQIVHIFPASPGELRTNDKLTESLVRKYIMLRTTVVADAKEMELRWGIDGPIKWMSDEGLYMEFSRAMAQESIWNEGRSREVEIISLLRTDSDVWSAQIETSDMSIDTVEPTVIKWVITMRVGYKNMTRVKYAQRLKNPLGFTVLSYRVQRAS
jgi:type IV secretory pathway component VirB8